jgi:hypothetical protein
MSATALPYAQVTESREPVCCERVVRFVECA